jgi:ABC-type phosphate transport system substrate-binding protein
MSARKVPRRLRALGGGAALLALTGILAACDYGPDNVAKKITVVGSDTTQDVMQRILLRYHFNQPDGYNKFDSSHDDMANVLAVQDPGLTVAADSDCAARTWVTPADDPGEFLAPNGSSNGRNALRDDTPGCVDIARSSAAPRAIGPTGDKATFEYYAYGVDGLGWATHPNSPAPANLTLAQLQGIFNCTFTDWSQVGGQAGPIQRYWPQSGSGTFQSAVSELMGGVNPFTISNPPSCPAAISTQENSGELIDANNHEATAIVPYSAGNWIAQANDVVNPDQRHGQELGLLNGFDFVVGSAPNFTAGSAIVEENVRLVDPTPAVPGIRFIFNVVDSAGPSYVTAKRYVGFENQANGNTSPLCSGKFASDISAFGFKPLDTSAVDASTNLANSTCRKYVPTA